jgi:uncharacterized protein with ParB-like and HNH nuclease domain
MDAVYEINGKTRSVRELLFNQKYSIDYYQREYKWETKHVQELLDDLSSKFLEFFKEQHERNEVAKYGHYFLGSIIISIKNSQKYIIDGQQRMTTLTLLLIFLHNLQKKNNTKKPVEVNDLIYSVQFGKKSFNIDVDERTHLMEQLFNGTIPDVSDASESLQNIVARYQDIAENYPEEIQNNTLPYFIDWLIEKVHLVEITTYSDDDAYTIFETMNDRGLSLSPTDMLKGYLLANITDEDLRNRSARQWKGWIKKFQDLGKDDETNFFKSWLRSQYARDIRERKRNAKPGDFDRLGTEFHRWVRDNKDFLQLEGSNEYFNFINQNLDFFARWYERIRKASQKINPKIKEVFYNANQDFTLQYPVLLAPLKLEDDDDLCLKKIRIVATYIDILIARRIWNYHSISASTMLYAMFITLRDIRHKNPIEISDILVGKIKNDTEPFESGENSFALHGQNGRRIHLLLARMTDYIEQKSGMPSHYLEYITGTGTKRYEVEHIWADHYERHTDEFSHPADFQNIRNRIGDLLLLQKSFNQSYGDLPYEDKLPHYHGQNLLAKSLHPRCYDHNPGFLRFVQESGLPFEPHEQFKKADIEKRQNLYKMIAEQIWDPKKLLEIASS